MSPITGWMHFGPTFGYFQIQTEGELLAAAKEPLYLGWTSSELIEESQKEDLLWHNLTSWKQLLNQHAVDSIKISLSPALVNTPLLVILRHQLKELHLPMPVAWSEIEEVQYLTRTFPKSKDDLVLFGLCEHRLYLVDWHTSQIEWHAALPLGLIDLQRQYCQIEPGEQPNLVELRRQIVTYLELIQWHKSPLNAVIGSDVACLLAAKQNDHFILTRTSLEKTLPILTHNSPRQVCRQLGIDSPLGFLLLPAALICQHILDYLQFTAIEVYPFKLPA